MRGGNISLTFEVHDVSLELRARGRRVRRRPWPFDLIVAGRDLVLRGQSQTSCVPKAILVCVYLESGVGPLAQVPQFEAVICPDAHEEILELVIAAHKAPRFVFTPSSEPPQKQTPPLTARDNEDPQLRLIETTSKRLWCEGWVRWKGLG